MNAVDRMYSVFGPEALAVVFVLKTFRIHLVSTHPFKLIKDHLAFCDAFRKKEMRRRLALWLDFPAEYDLEISFCTGGMTGAAEFLSRVCAQPSSSGDEVDLIHLAVSKNWFKSNQEQLQEFCRHLFEIHLRPRARRLEITRRVSKFSSYRMISYFAVQSSG